MEGIFVASLACLAVASGASIQPGQVEVGPVGGVAPSATFNYFKSLPTQSIVKLTKFAPALQELTPEIIEFLKTLDEDQYNLVIDSYIDLAYLTPTALEYLKSIPEETISQVIQLLPLVPKFVTEIKTFLRQYSTHDIEAFLNVLPEFSKVTQEDIAELKAKTDEELALIVKEKLPKFAQFTDNFIEVVRNVPTNAFYKVVKLAPLVTSVIPEVSDYFKYTPDAEIEKIALLEELEPGKTAGAITEFIQNASDEIIRSLHKITPSLVKYKSDIYQVIKSVPTPAIKAFAEVAPKLAGLTPNEITELQSNPQAYVDLFNQVPATH